MNSRPELSLVIPVFNVSRFLPACLDSIVAQTRQPDEIVVVDDGSTDDSPAVLLSYRDRLPQMRTLRQENGGLSAARNTGLSVARGRWLAFLDSDDRLAKDHCATALALAKDDDLDMALFNGWFDFDGHAPNTLIYLSEPRSRVMTGADLLKDRLERKCFFHMVWLHLYRREFIDSLGLRFVPPWIHEDVPWTTRALVAARRVRYDPAPLVFYRKPVRRPPPGAERDARWRLATESTAFNALELDKLVHELGDSPVARAISWQLIDGGLSMFHKLEKIDSPAMRSEVRRKLRSDGVFRILWRHATSFAHRRRILRNWLKSFL